jgi:hypothetical protein
MTADRVPSEAQSAVASASVANPAAAMVPAAAW